MSLPEVAVLSPAYVVLRYRFRAGKPVTFGPGEQVISVLEVRRPGLEVFELTLLMALPPAGQAGHEMPHTGDGFSWTPFVISIPGVKLRWADGSTGAELLAGGEPDETCPSCGGERDHNWIRSAGGLVSCARQPSAHLEEDR